MNKMIPTQAVKKVLRYDLGLYPLGNGNGTGHSLWSDTHGRVCHPLLSRKDVSLRVLYSLGLEMEAKGISTKRDFIRTCKGRAYQN